MFCFVCCRGSEDLGRPGLGGREWVGGVKGCQPDPGGEGVPAWPGDEGGASLARGDQVPITGAPAAG